MFLFVNLNILQHFRGISEVADVESYTEILYVKKTAVISALGCWHPEVNNFNFKI